MKAKNNDIFVQNSIFIWIALVTGLVLLIPWFAMQFDWRVPDPGSSSLDGVNWSLGDFIVMGTLLFGTGSIFALVARKVRTNSQRVVVGVVLALAFLYIWAELAVGIFTNWGS